MPAVGRQAGPSWHNSPEPKSTSLGLNELIEQKVGSGVAEAWGVPCGTLTHNARTTQLH